MAKDSTTAGDLLKIVGSRGQKILKTNCQTTSTSPHVVWEGFKKKYSSSSKTNSSIFSYQTRLELQMGLASMVR